MIYKPELTAIHSESPSESARMLCELANECDKVLDYGCGFGRNIQYMLENGLVYVDGTDTLAQLDKLQTEIFSNDLYKCELFKMHSVELELSTFLTSESYDYVLSSFVLNVVTDEWKRIILDDMNRLLKPNGTLIVEVRANVKAKLKVQFHDGFLIRKGKSKTFQEVISKDKMEALLEEAGFAIEKHIFNSNKHIVVAKKIKNSPVDWF
jgi:SAM-dependent methyltransferase